MPAGPERAEVLRVQAEHVARKQREKPLVGGVRVRQRVHEHAHDLHLGKRREGRAARDDALEAALAQGVDVVGGVARAPEQQRHVVRVLAGRRPGGETVGDLRGHGGDAVVGARRARDLDVDARQVAGLIGVAARGVRRERHKTRQQAAPGGRAVEELVDEGEDIGVATVVDVEPAVVALVHAAPALLEDAHVGPSETVDGLLGVAHRAEPLAAAREHADELDLARVGVLELVDHHQAELLGVAPGDAGVVAQGREAAGDEVVIVQVRALELERLIRRGELPREPDQGRQVLGQAGEPGLDGERADGRLELLGALLGRAVRLRSAAERLEGAAGLGLGAAARREGAERAQGRRQRLRLGHGLLGLAGAALVDEEALVVVEQARDARGHGLRVEKAQRLEAARRAPRELHDVPREAHDRGGRAPRDGLLGEERADRVGQRAHLGLVGARGEDELLGAAAEGVAQVVGEHPELRVDAEIERMPAQDARAHAVDRRDPGVVNGERLLLQAVLAQGGAHALLDLEGGRVGEGDDERLVEGVDEGPAVGGRALRERPGDAPREGEGLAGAGARLDEERAVEGLGDGALGAVQCGEVDRHGLPRPHSLVAVEHRAV